jgi:hypothetical protein
MTQQIETATVIVATTIGTSGNAAVIITSAYMSNSPKTFSVAVSSGDDAAAVAGKIRVALVYDADVSAQFVVSGATDKVILTAHVARANDTTLNISVANDTCAGITNVLTSANTQAGTGLTNSYATLAEYKSWIAVRGLAGSVGTDTNDDAAIEILIEGASRYLDRETGSRFYADTSDQTRYYTAQDDECVYIDNLSAAPTSLSCDFSGLRSYTALASTDYDLLPDNALLDGYPYNKIELVVSVATRLFPMQRRGIQVIGKFGYPSVPLDIKEACLSITQNTYSMRSGQSSGGNITVTAAGVVIRPQEVPAMAQKVIEHYRNIT